MAWMDSLYHYGMSSGKQFDPLYRTSVVGSYILPNSYRKLKPHRSWWSFYMPHNIYIPQEIYSLLTTDLSNIFQHGHFDINEPFNGDFDTVLSFSPDQSMNSLFKTL